MVLEFLSQLQGSTLTLLILFFFFVLLAFKVFKLIIRLAIFGLVGASFPLFSGVLGLEIAVTLDNIVYFAVLAMTAYLAYYIIVNIGRIIKLLMKPFKWVFTKKEKKS